MTQTNGGVPPRVHEKLRRLLGVKACPAGWRDANGLEEGLSYPRGAVFGSSSTLIRRKGLILRIEYAKSSLYIVQPWHGKASVGHSADPVGGTGVQVIPVDGLDGEWWEDLATEIPALIRAADQLDTFRAEAERRTQQRAEAEAARERRRVQTIAEAYAAGRDQSLHPSRDRRPSWGVPDNSWTGYGVAVLSGMTVLLPVLFLLMPGVFAAASRLLGMNAVSVGALVLNCTPLLLVLGASGLICVELGQRFESLPPWRKGLAVVGAAPGIAAASGLALAALILVLQVIAMVLIVGLALCAILPLIFGD